jgi:quercetin dioxygenase-like cupin family protein
MTLRSSALRSCACVDRREIATIAIGSATPQEETAMTNIHTPTREELERRVSRYGELKEMTTRSKELAGISQDAVDIIFARKIMPVILDNTKNPFGSYAPIIGAAGTTMFISILPPGQGPCLHSHNGTYETFMVLEGRIEYHIGEPIAHRITLDKWDAFSCPPFIYRGFRNVGTTDAVQLTVITGLTQDRDDVSMPDSIAQQVRREHGEPVLDAFKTVFKFDPPRAA